MKNPSPELLAHYQSENTTLATCWKATRTDGEIFGYTDHDADIVYSGITYLAATGYTPTAISTEAALNVDNLDLEGMLDADNITENDLLAGLWGQAEIEIFEVNYADLTMGLNPLCSGTLGEISMKRQTYTAELRGMMQALQQTVGRICTPACDADLGDARCGVNLATYTFAGSIDTLTSTSQWADADLTQAAGYFNGGLVTWTSGLNTGLAMEVKTYTGGNVKLQQPMPYVMAAGDAYTISRGCDKSRATCKANFSNVINHRGFPDVPGQDAVTKGAS